MLASVRDRKPLSTLHHSRRNYLWCYTLLSQDSIIRACYLPELAWRAGKDNESTGAGRLNNVLVKPYPGVFNRARTEWEGRERHFDSSALALKARPMITTRKTFTLTSVLTYILSSQVYGLLDQGFSGVAGQVRRPLLRSFPTPQRIFHFDHSLHTTQMTA